MTGEGHGVAEAHALAAGGGDEVRAQAVAARPGGTAEDRQLDALASLVGLAAARVEEIAALDRRQVLDPRRGDLGATPPPAHLTP